MNYCGAIKIELTKDDINEAVRQFIKSKYGFLPSSHVNFSCKPIQDPAGIWQPELVLEGASVYVTAEPVKDKKYEKI